MATDRPKAPIDLNDLKKGDGEEKEAPRTGSIGYTGPPNPPAGTGYSRSSPPPKRDWMPGIVGGVVGIIAAGIMVFTLTAGAGDVATLNNRINELSDQVVTVQETVNANGSRIDNVTNSMGGYVSDDDLSGYATKAELEDIGGASAEEVSAAVTAAVTPLDARIAVLEAEVDALQEDDSFSGSSSDGSSADEFEEVRWSFRTPDLDSVTTNPADYDLWDLDIDVDDRIEDEGLYYVELAIRNDNGVAISNLNAAIELVLIPRDDALLDEDETYFDSDDAPWLDWDADFVTKTREGREVTKRVTFTSDREDLGAWGVDETREFEYVLELYYDWDE